MSRGCNRGGRVVRGAAPDGRWRMPDKYFLSSSGTIGTDGFISGADLMASVHGERVLWSGHCAVAEYAFDEPASLPRWTLAEETEVVITEARVVYANFASQAV